MKKASKSRVAPEEACPGLRLLTNGLLGALLLLGAQGASAQQVGTHLEAGGLWGRSFGGTFARGSNEYFDRAVEADTAISAGLRLAYNLSPRLVIELQAERVNTLFVETADGLFASRPQVGLRVDVRPRFVYLGTRGLGEDTGTFDSGRWLRQIDGDMGLFVAF
jgi:hypothetical protein